MNFKLPVVFFCFLIVSETPILAQRDTFRLMQYNLLFFPENNPVKASYLNTILEYYQPDVIGLNELTDSSAFDSIASSTPVGKWAFGPWYPDEVISNGVMYNPQRLVLASSFAFQTLPRKTHVYKFYNPGQDFELYPDTVYMTFLSTHFKSSQGSTNENTRLIQAIDINDYIRVFEPSNLVLTGDFNMYTSAEPAYQRLTEPGSDRLEDPLNRPGSWNNNGSFADVHTQSPRTISLDGGSGGGLDDRFDIILVRPEIMQGTGGLTYIPGSYHVPGNDGMHFNRSILDLPENNSAPDSILQALYAMSDHLPVLLDLEFDPSQVSTQTADYNNLPCDEFIGLQAENYLLNKSTKIYNLQGSEIEAESLILSKKYGIYIIKHLCNNGDYIYRKMHITVSGDLLFSH
jgi:hypothetical protein